MVTDRFNFIDFDGIDLIYSQGRIIPGLYVKLLTASSTCKIPVIFNWKFNAIEIPPAYVTLTIGQGVVSINSGVSVDENDVLTIETLEYITRSLSVIENGVYTVSGTVKGFNPVSVDVNPPLQSKTVTSNGLVTPDEGFYGLSNVNVEIATQQDNTFISTEYGDWMNGWFSNRRINRILASGDKLIGGLLAWTSGYSVGCFYTLRDYGAVGNVINGDYATKLTLTDIEIPGLGITPIYCYGGMNGSGRSGSANLYFTKNGKFENENVSPTLTNIGQSANAIYFPTNETNGGAYFNSCSQETKNYIFDLLKQTL